MFCVHDTVCAVLTKRTKKKPYNVSLNIFLVAKIQKPEIRATVAGNDSWEHIGAAKFPEN